ncbi:hypothetical protein FB451DRAFT_1569502 [Mycena latifolia]|nr:hypothetical protein FB451DRAFT_1569502 [Mycena latifolia]
MASIAHGSEPRMPLELEKEIFEWAGASQPRSIPKLILVARRVKAWIEPMLYRVICVVDDGDHPFDNTNRLRMTNRTCLKMIDSKPASFFHKYVHHVALDSPLINPEHQECFLSRFSGAVSLALFDTFPNYIGLVPILNSMPLLRLAVDLSDLLTERIEATSAMFARVTHLELLDVPREYFDFGRMPHLTHLAFHWKWRAFPPGLCLGVLGDCKLLKVLACLFPDDALLEEHLTDYRFFKSDPRAVVMLVDDHLLTWEAGANGDEDHWVRAARFIAQRRSGEIRASDYVIAGDTVVSER